MVDGIGRVSLRFMLCAELLNLLRSDPVDSRASKKRHEFLLEDLRVMLAVEGWLSISGNSTEINGLVPTWIAEL